MAVSAYAGDTYSAINAKGDYINYASCDMRDNSHTRIIVAPDSARYEPRWQLMLDPYDLRKLEFIRARNTTVFQFER